MSLKQRSEDSAGALTIALDAPDDYQSAEFQNHESNMSDLKELWADIRMQLKRDLDQVELVERKLIEMRAAFDSRDTDTGRKANYLLD
jgi:hypothetical protein